MHPSLRTLIDSTRKVVVLTGAGISTESGIPDFRSQNGIWSTFDRREYYISRSFFESNPQLFWKYYKEMFELEKFNGFEPNTGHRYLAQLEHQGKQVRIYTQNADGLHQKAGSTEVFEVHGSLLTATCPTCQHQYNLSYILERPVPTCLHDNSVLNPGMVLFGDPIQYLREAIDDVSTADVFLVFGTSLQVGPINELPRIAKYHQVPSALINQEQTVMDSLFNLVFHEKIGSLLDTGEE